MREEDQPPESIYLDDEALSEHFDRVREKYSSSSTDREPIEQVPLEQNEATKGLRRGR
jgi:hypothetical protein